MVDFRAWARSGFHVTPENDLPQLRFYTVGQFLEWAHARKWSEKHVERILDGVARVLGLTTGGQEQTQGAMNATVFNATNTLVVGDNVNFMGAYGYGAGGGGGGGGVALPPQRAAVVVAAGASRARKYSRRRRAARSRRRSTRAERRAGHRWVELGAMAEAVETLFYLERAAPPSLARAAEAAVTTRRGHLLEVNP